MGEVFHIGTKYTPRNPAEAMRWYRAAVGGGDPAKANGPLYAKLRIAEMYEDGEGVARDLDEAGRIYGEVLNLLGIWRGASFACDSANGLGEPSKGAPHGDETRSEERRVGRYDIVERRPADHKIGQG